jgi:uncharacterized protein (TIGR02687 family)
MELFEAVTEQFERNPNLRILFFFDEIGEYKDELDKWPDGEVLCIVSDKKYFGLKYKLEKELIDRKVFLYFPYKEPSLQEKEEFPLLDLVIANKQLHLDPVKSFLEEYGLAETYTSIIQRFYQSELRFKNRRDFLGSILSNAVFSPARLKKGLISYHLGLTKVMDPNQCIARIIALAMDEAQFTDALDRIKRLDLAKDILPWIEEIFEIREKELTLALMQKLANVIKYNLITRTLGNLSEEDQYSSLRLDALQLNRLWGFYLDWINEPALKPYLDKVLEKLASQVNEDKLIEWYGLEATFGYWTPGLKNNLLIQCIHELRFQPVRIKERIKPWYDQVDQEAEEYKALLNYIWNASSLFEMLKGEPSFRFNFPEEYIMIYAKEFHLVDRYYRKATIYFSETQKYSYPPDMGLDESMQQLHDIYEDQFVSKINYEWMQCMKEHGFAFIDIPLATQYNFYKDQIEGADQRIAVIISDAFRFEIASELLDILSGDSKNTGNLSPMLASVPSHTALGMANLLPNSSLEIEGKSYSIKGISTEGLENRKTILRNFNPSATAISYKELNSLSITEGREFFKQWEVIYIYHNRIDAVGDTPKSEMNVFEAAESSLTDIQVLLKKLYSWNVYKTIITSDHGFLMSMRKISDTQKEEMPEITGEFISHNRCVVAESITESGGGYLFDLSKSSAVKSSLKVMVPRSVNRFKKQGSGDQYVHSGASLQELIVPVLVYSRKRTDESVPVAIRLIRFDQRITSGYMKAEVLQLEPIGHQIKERILHIGLYASDGTLISQEEKIILNSTSKIPTERTFKVMLNLGSRGTRETTCLLKGFEEGDKLNPLFEERIIIQTLIEKDEF